MEIEDHDLAAVRRMCLLHVTMLIALAAHGDPGYCSWMHGSMSSSTYEQPVCGESTDFIAPGYNYTILQQLFYGKDIPKMLLLLPLLHKDFRSSGDISSCLTRVFPAEIIPSIPSKFPGAPLKRNLSHIGLYGSGWWRPSKAVRPLFVFFVVLIYLYNTLQFLLQETPYMRRQVCNISSIYAITNTMLKMFRGHTGLLPLLLLLYLPLTLATSRRLPQSLLPRAKTGNPIIDGWYADPELRIYEDTYYLYPTYSAAFDNQTFFDAFVSSDLLTWERAGRMLDFADVPWTTNRAAWAPTVGHKDGLYYLYYSAGDGVGIGVAIASSPAGPFEDVLGGPLVGEYAFGAQPIDAMVFMDSDGDEGGKGEGRNYLYWGGRGHAVVGELAEDMVSFKGEFREVTPEKEYVEGPWMLKRKGVYYFLYSVGGWGDPSYAVKYVKADNPLGPFSGPSKLILSSDRNIGTSTGHNSVFNVGDDYYIVYHRRFPTDNERDHRVVCIDRMYFDDDGEIRAVKITNEGVDGREL